MWLQNWFQPVVRSPVVRIGTPGAFWGSTIENTKLQNASQSRSREKNVETICHPTPPHPTPPHPPHPTPNFRPTPQTVNWGKNVPVSLIIVFRKERWPQRRARKIAPFGNQPPCVNKNTRHLFPGDPTGLGGSDSLSILLNHRSFQKNWLGLTSHSCLANM